MITPIILSGGFGTRLWPVSREKMPKQFNTDVSNPSLFEKTHKLIDDVNFAKPVIVANVKHELLVDDAISSEYEAMLLEPESKNTAPAIIAAAIYVKQKYGNNANILVLPSDHLITEKDKFIKSILNGVNFIKNNIVIFGVKPTFPSTGFGYIEIENSSKLSCYKVKQFKEKPDIYDAEKFYTNDSFFWNAGIFLFNVEYFLKIAKELTSEMFSMTEKSLQCAKIDGKKHFLSEDFSYVKSNSVDYEILEKHKSICMVKMLSKWNDVGSFSSLYEVSKKDDHNNVVDGRVHINDTQNSFIKNTTNKMLAVSNIKDITIIQTSDVMLVMPLSKSQNVKQVLETLTVDSLKEEHTKIRRSWGTYEVLYECNEFKIKKIIVDPQQSLSLQRHEYRSENWIVVKGVATVINNENTLILNIGDSAFIPKQTKHRLCNKENDTLEIIEIQMGVYLGEDDITRYNDL